LLVHDLGLLSFGARRNIRERDIGVDASVLHERREEHWGLSGMRERAKAIGGTLEVRSEEGAGTEVELAIPFRWLTEVLPPDVFISLLARRGRFLSGDWLQTGYRLSYEHR
jgi:hypothetical protein